MVKNLLFSCLLILVPLTQQVNADELSVPGEKNWELWSHSTLIELLSYGLKIQSSDAVPRPEGGYALIVYLKKTGKHGALWRCIDITNDDFKPVRQMCYKLVVKVFHPPGSRLGVKEFLDNLPAEKNEKPSNNIKKSK